jgi:hypothetical protein
VISNSPIILIVDCDVYSNNSDSIRDALCFFMDEEMGHKVGYVQYPQNYTNLTKNDIYGNSLNVINEVIATKQVTYNLEVTYDYDLTSEP